MAFMGMNMNAAGGVMAGLQHPVPAQPSAPDQQHPFAELVSLKGLLDQGIITQEDFDAAKARILGI